MKLVTEIYRVSKDFPRDELYGLTNQLRRAAVSIPSSVAEGYARNSRNELHHFIGQARGSLAELETQIEIAANLGYLSEQLCTELLRASGEVGRMLTGLRSWSAKP